MHSTHASILLAVLVFIAAPGPFVLCQAEDVSIEAEDASDTLVNVVEAQVEAELPKDPNDDARLPNTGEQARVYITTIISYGVGPLILFFGKDVRALLLLAQAVVLAGGFDVMRRCEQIHSVHDIDVSLISEFAQMIVSTGTIAFTSLGSSMGGAMQGGMVASFVSAPIVSMLDRPAREWAGCDMDAVGASTAQHPGGEWLNCEEQCEMIGTVEVCHNVKEQLTMMGFLAVEWALVAVGVVVGIFLTSLTNTVNAVTIGATMCSSGIVNTIILLLSGLSDDGFNDLFLEQAIEATKSIKLILMYLLMALGFVVQMRGYCGAVRCLLTPLIWISMGIERVFKGKEDKLLSSSKA